VIEWIYPVGKPLVVLKQSLAVKGEAAVSFFMQGFKLNVNPFSDYLCF